MSDQAVSRTVSRPGQGNLLPGAPEGNVNGVRHGLYSRTGRVLAPRAEELADALMQAPHVNALDCIAAEEIGALQAHLEAVEEQLRQPGRKERKTLLEHRIRLTRELRSWLREFGATPKARAEFARELAAGGLAAEIARRRQAAREREEHSSA